MITKLALFGIMLLMATPVVAQEQNLKDKLVISISNDFEPSRSWMSKVSGSLPGMGAGSGPKEKSGKGRHFLYAASLKLEKKDGKASSRIDGRGFGR